jgi:DNA-binding transcriptional LysR family regulator
LELRHLRYFLGIADQESFVKAAEVLRVAQPALSRQIKDLEDELGGLLFERHPRGVSLTEFGELFKRRAIEILRLVELTENEARSFSSEFNRKVRIGLFGSLAYSPLYEVIGKFERAFPNADLKFNYGSIVEKIDNLLLGKLDLVFALAPIDRFASNQIEIISTIFEPSYVLVREGHFLQNFSRVTIDQAVAQELVLLSSSVRPQADALVKGLEKASNKKANIVHFANDYNEIFESVRSGAGISIIPQSTIKFKSDKLKFIRLSDGDLLFRYHLLSTSKRIKHERNLPSMFNKFIECFKEETSKKKFEPRIVTSIDRSFAPELPVSHANWDKAKLNLM